ncbi:hypothetical protein ABIA48_004412 [Pseudomonas sp. S30_BP2TU TE3576]
MGAFLLPAIYVLQKTRCGSGLARENGNSFNIDVD